MSRRLYMVDVNNFLTWVEHPERTCDVEAAPQAVPNFRWKVDSHPEDDMWVDGRHVVRWWFKERPK